MKVVTVGIGSINWKMTCECPNCLAILEISREDLFLKKYVRSAAGCVPNSVVKVVCTCISCQQVFSIIDFKKENCGELPYL